MILTYACNFVIRHKVESPLVNEVTHREKREQRNENLLLMKSFELQNPITSKSDPLVDFSLNMRFYLNLLA